MDIATRWYIVYNSIAIKQPPILHPSTPLKVGDIFLNKYFSASHKSDVLQVWLLLASNEQGCYWSQVQVSEIALYHQKAPLIIVFQPPYYDQVFGETEHPNLPGFVLSFQPSQLSAPSWVRRVTERRRCEWPHILGPGEGTFIEGTSQSH